MPQYGVGVQQVNLKTITRVTYILLLCLLASGSFSLSSPLFANNLYQDESQGLSSDLQMVRTLIKADVLDLAESILENQAPRVLPTEEWLAWERQLWSLYAYRNKWDKLYIRATQVPPSFPESIRNEALDQALNALLEQAKGVEARRMIIRRMVSTQLSLETIRQYRKQIIKSYLSDDLLSDAASSMSNYQREFRYFDEDWLFQRAEVFLKLGQPDKAINVLAPSDLPRAKLLALYARLVHQSMSPKQASERLDSTLFRDEEGVLRNGLTEVEIAAVETYLAGLIDIHEYVKKLEQYFIIKNEFVHSVEGGFPVFTLSELIRVYEEYAIQLISDQGHLENDLQGIYEWVVTLPITDILQQRVLSAYLLSRIKDPKQRISLCNLLVISLLNSGNIELIADLFGPDTPLGQLSIGGDVGLVLSNAMLNQGQVQLAAQIIDSMSGEPKNNLDSDRWMLHKARVFVVAGRFLSSFQQLRQLINNFSELPSEQMDEILIPIFDLQKFRQHDYALVLLKLLRTKVTTQPQDRELAYWIGESYQATHQYITAANYFLYSALLENEGFDLWGISARYYAAQSLESAHLYADARKLYRSLLDYITDEARLTELNQKIRDLSLWESGSFDVGDGLVEGKN